MLDPILPHIALWGLLFAVLNLHLILQKHLRDPAFPIYSKVAVIIFAGVLAGYALAIGGFALNEALYEGIRNGVTE